MASEGHHNIPHHLSDQATKLKLLLEKDDERKRQTFIRNIAEIGNTSIEQPPHKAVSVLASNQASVENQLQEEVNFYENALQKLQKRSEEITEENKKLYETMNKSLLQEKLPSNEREDNGKSSLFRPKERLLRTKDEFQLFDQPKLVRPDDSHNSYDEPGQITFETNNKKGFLECHGSDLYDFDDSLASEPGQVPGYPNDYERNTNEDKKVSFSLPIPKLQKTDNYKFIAHSGENLSKQSLENNVFQNGLDSTNLPSEPLMVFDCESFNNELKKIQDLYETKTKQLEVLLKTSKKENEEHVVEISNLKGELKIYQTPVKDSSVDFSFGKLGFVKASEKNLVQELLLEREELFEAIKKQQCIVAEGNRHETEAYYHVKKSCEMVEQAQLEKQDAIVRSKQLEKELDSYKDKYNVLQTNHQDELIKVKNTVKQEMGISIEELNKKLEEKTLNLSILQNHLEKSVREKMDFKNELSKFERHNASQSSTSTAMIEESQKEVMEALKRQTLAEHETGQIRLEAKLSVKRKQQEVDQLLLEVNELKRRLYVTEENLNVSQKYQLDLTNQCNSSKQQLHQETLKRKMLITSFEEERKRLQEEGNQREQELSQVIIETDKCYQLAKEELSKMLESQSHIVNKYQNECKELTDKVTADQKQHQVNIAQLRDKCLQLEINLRDALNKEQRKEDLLENFKQQIESTSHELKQKKELVMLLMTKQSAILRDRYLLSKEVELLKSQLPTGTLAD